MGEEKKEEAKKEEEKKKEGEAKEESKKEEEKKEEEKKQEEPQEIVLKVDMHCEACGRKVAKALKGFQGVEDVITDYKASKVVVKGKTADPMKVCERIQKKSGRKVEIISPLPKPPPEKKDDEIKEPPKEDKKDEPPPVTTVVLKLRMHCEGCAQALQKRIRKVKGVESVTTDIANDQVTVKGVVNPEKLVNDVYKKTKKQASIVKGEEEEEKKEEEKKKEEDEKQKGEEKKEGEEAKAEEDKNTSDIKKSEYWPPKYYMEYEFAYYTPQYFSDENPNACCVM